MRIAICDDDSIDIDIIKDLLNIYFSDKSVAYQIISFEDGTNLIYDIEDNISYDLVFLDIYMNNHLGIDVAKKLREIKYEGDIVFLTSSPDYAIDSYDVNASGYLLKPHSYEKLKAVMDRIIKKYEISTYIIHQRKNSTRIPYNEILYVESCNTKCILHRQNGKNYVIYKKLCEIEKELDDQRFIRCHQSYIVNMNHIQHADTQFTLFNGEIIMIRQKDIRAIREKYLEYINHTQL